MNRIGSDRIGSGKDPLRRDCICAALIYEVRNTFGGMHAYVLPVGAAEVSAAGTRRVQDKTFYVSPFIGMAMRYHFRRPANRSRCGSSRVTRRGGRWPRLSAAAATT